MRPKRKRGFHRALKRGEVWALTDNYIRVTLNTILRQMYDKPLEDQMKIIPLSQLLKK